MKYFSYITPRLISLKYPDTQDTMDLLTKRHENDMLIINLSGQTLKNSVEYKQLDDFMPSLNMIFSICKQMDDYLSSKISNIVVVCCNSGKNKSGLIICSYLLFCNRFENTQEVLQYYEKKKYGKGGGLSQPVYIRYLEYVEQLLKKKRYPLAIFISSVNLNGIPSCRSNACRPYLEIYNSEKLIYCNREQNHKNQRKYKQMKITESTIIRMQIRQPILVCGDVLIKIFNRSDIEDTFLFQITFNTAFIEDQTLLLNKSELDPKSSYFDPQLPNEFSVDLEFDEYCICDNQTLCKSCKGLRNQWQQLHNILEQRQTNSQDEAKLLIFGDLDFDDINEMKYKQLNYIKKGESIDIV
ncbi:hypothetical protein pb186bvf_018232 [Paramecium bursaria]